MQTEQIVGLIISVISLVLLAWIIIMVNKILSGEPSPQPDNKSYQTKKEKAEVSQHGYNEVVTFTDKRDSDLIKDIDDDDS